MGSVADDAMSALVSLGYTSGSLSDRQRAYLLDSLGASPSLSTSDLMQLAGFPVADLLTAEQLGGVSPSGPVSLFGSSIIPGLASYADAVPQSWVMDAFTIETGTITKVRFYQFANTKTDYGIDVLDGKIALSGNSDSIQSFEFILTDAAGWNELALTTPLEITTGTYLGVELLLWTGHYSFAANIQNTSANGITYQGSFFQENFDILVSNPDAPQNSRTASSSHGIDIVVER